MAQCKLTPHEFIQNSFSPMVAVMCSPMVDQACQKNNLSFVEMIQPFCKLDAEAYIREVSGTPVPVRNLRIAMVDVHSRPPQPTLARKFLNESVSSFSCEKGASLQVGSQTIDIPASVPWFEAWRDTFLQVQFPSDHEFTKHYIACMFVVSSAESNTADILQQMSQQLQQMQNMTPAKLPKWFCPNVLRYYVLLHDTTDTNSELLEVAFNTMKTAYGATNSFLLQINSRPPGQNEGQYDLPDPWSQFLIRQSDNQQEVSHDSSPRTPADMGGVTGMPSRLTTDASCDGEPNETRPVTLEVGQEAGEQASVAVTLHPLSPDTESTINGPHAMYNNTDKNHLSTKATSVTVSTHINANVWAGQTSTASQSIEHGACLTINDLEMLRNMMQEFATKALLPYIEKQIQQFTDMISNRKGVSRSLFSATKRWFGSNKPGVPGSNAPVNAVIYTSDAPELQLRRLGDLCFMFGHYTLAFQAYHSAKRDFSADQAWLYYAGALEMASLSAFMQGEPTRKAQDYMEESILTYLNSCKMPQFATRATLMSTECLKGRNLYGEAAKQFIRMTSEDSDLRSALLLEQASYCFLKATRPRMSRKYAFHIVLAGHRYSKAGQRKHSLRCYRQAYQVYEGKSWSLAEDHIHFTIGRQAANLNQVREAATAFSHLLSLSSRQSTMQQAAFLKEFLATQKQLQDEESSSDNVLPILPLPLADSNKLRVILGFLPSPPSENIVPATGVNFEEDSTDHVTWPKLEEMLLSEAQGSPPMIFKPTITLFSNKTNNANKPLGVVGEPVNVSLKLENPLHIPLPLQNVRLLWSFTSLQDVRVDNEINAATADTVVETQCIESLLLTPDFTQEVILSVTPKAIGDLQILGVAYNLTSLPVESAGNQVHAATALAVPGKQVFNVKPPRPKTGNEKVTPDRRLEITILEAAPCLQITFTSFNTEMLSGELQLVTIKLVNVGSTSLKSVLVGWSKAELLSLGEPSLRDTGQVQQLRNRGHLVTRIVLPGAGTLAPGQSHEIPMWLRAPDTIGQTTIDMLFYYENVNSQSIPRFRLVRHSCTLLVLSSIHSTVVANRSDAISRHSGEEVLNLMMSIKNNNHVQDPVVTELSVLQLALASQVWRLTDQVVVPQAVNLKSQEMVHLMVKAQRLTEGKSIFSHVQMGDSIDQLSPVDTSPYLDFFNRRIESSDLTDHTSSHHTQMPDNPPTHSRDISFKEIKTTLKVNATLIIRWKAAVTDGEGKSRIVVGQHHLTVDRVGVLASCPPLNSAIATQLLEPIGSLKIFGPDAEPAINIGSADKYTPFEVLQKLVTYSIQHLPSIEHDFKQCRICIVPVRLLLRNCSDSHLVVRVNTMGNSSSTSSNKNQLYSPHSSGAFRWVTLASAWVDIKPHGHGAVALSAALAAPGTFDLGARLEVNCRIQGSPESDTVTQTCRIESSLVVENNVKS